MYEMILTGPLQSPRRELSEKEFTKKTRLMKMILIWDS